MASIHRLLVAITPFLAFGGHQDEGKVCSSSGSDSGVCGAGRGWATGADDGEEDTPCHKLLDVLSVRESQVASRSQPAVIRGVPKAAKWDVEAFHRDKLRERFGSVRVRVFSPAQAALMQGISERVHSLGKAIEKLRDTSHSVYVFDPKFFQNSSNQKIAKIPKNLSMKGRSQILTMGGISSGTQFHSHGPAFLTLLAGRKRWYMHKPGTFPKESVTSLPGEVSSWATDVLPNLSGKAPISCVQHPGETVFVPDSWSHATINLDETVGVAWQLTSSAVDICKSGEDYFCLQQAFASVHLYNRAEQPSRFRALFADADEITGGLPLGFLHHLGPYWQVSSDAGRLFKRSLANVSKLLKRAKPHSDEAVLAAVLTKVLAEVLFTAKRDVKKTSSLLMPAVQKVPESGIGVSLAQLLGQHGRWQEAVQQLERHIASFPDDPQAAEMLVQAKGFAKR